MHWSCRADVSALRQRQVVQEPQFSKNQFILMSRPCRPVLHPVPAGIRALPPVRWAAAWRVVSILRLGDGQVVKLFLEISQEVIGNAVFVVRFQIEACKLKCNPCQHVV